MSYKYKKEYSEHPIGFSIEMYLFPDYNKKNSLFIMNMQINIKMIKFNVIKIIVFSFIYQVVILDLIELKKINAI